MTSIEDVHRILDALESAGVSVSIGGGWGVDALVGRQTRPHVDVDLCFGEDQSEAATAALEGLGCRLTVDERPTRFVVEGEGFAVDMHPLLLEDDGWAVLPGPAGTDYRFPPGSMDAVGTIGGRAVRCFTIERQLEAHGGYEPSDKDLADLRWLEILALGQGGHRAAAGPPMPVE